MLIAYIKGFMAKRILYYVKYIMHNIFYHRKMDKSNYLLNLFSSIKYIIYDNTILKPECFEL